MKIVDYSEFIENMAPEERYDFFRFVDKMETAKLNYTLWFMQIGMGLTIVSLLSTFIFGIKWAFIIALAVIVIYSIVFVFYMNRKLSEYAQELLESRNNTDLQDSQSK